MPIDPEESDFDPDFEPVQPCTDDESVQLPQAVDPFVKKTQSLLLQVYQAINSTGNSHILNDNRRLID